MNPDPFYTLNQIQMEIRNLERDHVYYSIDEQPEACARLIAQGIRGHKSSGDILEQMKEDTEEVMKQMADALGFDPRQTIGNLFKGWGKRFAEGFDQAAAQEIFGHRVSVTVQSWEDVPAAIGLIRERQREFKRGMG